MDLRGIFSEDHLLFQKSVRQFMEREVLPHADESDRTGDSPPGLVHRLGELGYLGLRYPAEIGGSDGDFVSVCIFMEEFYRASAGLAALAEIQIGLGTMPIYLAGTSEQRERYLRPALAGELIGAFAMTEPDAGSDAASLKSRAERTSTGWEISGSKNFITNGTRADYLVVAARTGGVGPSGISLFIVDRHAHGLAPGRRIETLGLRASDTSEIVFEDLKLPRDALLGVEGAGFKILMQTLNEGRIMVAAESVGLASAALESALSYARSRRQFGQEIGKFQAVRFRLADMATDVAAARVLTYQAAKNVDAGIGTPAEAAAAKLFASEVATRVAASALHIHGGYGLAMEFPVQRYLRDSFVNEIVEGTSEIQREVIARGLEL